MAGAPPPRLAPCLRVPPAGRLCQAGLPRQACSCVGPPERSMRGGDVCPVPREGQVGLAPTSALLTPNPAAFYTSRYGYKMCLRVYLNGDGTGRGTHLSLFFVVMKGPHDALLRWPFNQKVRCGCCPALRGRNCGPRASTDAARPGEPCPREGLPRWSAAELGGGGQWVRGLGKGLVPGVAGRADALDTEQTQECAVRGSAQRRGPGVRGQKTSERAPSPRGCRRADGLTLSLGLLLGDPHAA